MIAEPHIEKCVLAGPTPPAAVARFRLAVRKVMATHDVLFLPCKQRHLLGSIRIAPPLPRCPVPERFRAIVNWWAVDDERT